ncbi:MAG: reverse transcriptase domain-containing protein [Syntrophobacteraceae bacterium]|nr:reverse transcriptase domain-containing protein [Syntrophobacteraceae bacterium]
MDLKLRSPSETLRDRFLSLRRTEDIADLLEVKYSDFLYWTYRTHESRRYSSFKIPKKSGAPRRIDAPTKNIKILQQKLNIVLQKVYRPKNSVHGFIATKSVKTNAERHVGRKHLLNIDLKDFFPSINFGRVRGMFMATPYNLPEKVATFLAHLCCYKGSLPQGAPTSPIISNMICAKMDSQLQRLAALNRCVYTRYADDMSFSTSRRTFPAAIAVENDLGQVEAGLELTAIIHSNGFSLHPQKIWLRRRDRRQEVTGVTVNVLPNLPRKFTNNIRAMLHAWEKFGCEMGTPMKLCVSLEGFREFGPQRFESIKRSGALRCVRGRTKLNGLQRVVQGRTKPNGLQPKIEMPKTAVFRA